MSSSLHSSAVILVKCRVFDRGSPEASETPLADLAPLGCCAASRMWMSGSARTGAITTWSRRRTRAMTPKRWAACVIFHVHVIFQHLEVKCVLKKATHVADVQLMCQGNLPIRVDSANWCTYETPD